MTTRPADPPADGTNTPSGDTVQAFAADLSSLRASAGGPTLARLSERTGISKSVLSEAFAGRRLPSENTVRRLTAALDAPEGEWVARRTTLDPRLADPLDRTTPTPTAETPKRSEWLRRPVSTGALILAMLGTAVVTATMCAALIPLMMPAPAAEPEASTDAPFGNLPVEDGVDPMRTVCKDDVVLAGTGDFLDGDVHVEMMYSNQCMGVWGRVTRNDGLAAGNELTIRIYPRDDPESERSQMRTDTDLDSLYTTLLIEPDVDARVCGVATVTVDGEEFVQPDPVCI
ncbi:helix-turn-helix domain-containing protein [Microbacterium karelineae]|uniref:helix-turn-helix domain-containing protein n=1 Tax=Microbacterium karelineae TaxID=2654283 RepID=UPI0012EA8F1A|nr:helix-turn-helix transcriptional regulator [Microbacterium karelineae]